MFILKTNIIHSIKVNCGINLNKLKATVFHFIGLSILFAKPLQF